MTHCLKTLSMERSYCSLLLLVLYLFCTAAHLPASCSASLHFEMSATPLCCPMPLVLARRRMWHRVCRCCRHMCGNFLSWRRQRRSL